VHAGISPGSAGDATGAIVLVLIPVDWSVVSGVWFVVNPNGGTWMRTTVGMMAVTVLLAGPMVAQSPRGPVPVRAGLTAASGELRTANSATAELRRQVAADSMRETQWLKGGVIGAVILDLLFIPLAIGFDGLNENSSTNVPMLVLGTSAIGFFIGALIGGQFEK
jgi:hypothetical protein